MTLIGGKTTTVNFNNTLKRGSLEIIKNSEDNLVEGVKFPNVFISGDTPYVVEEVDTAVRYVVPASQTAPIE